MTLTDQLTFDLDALTAPAYSGPAIGWHPEPLPLDQLTALEEHGRRTIGSFGLHVGSPHLWHASLCQSNDATPGHTLTGIAADLGCGYKKHSHCQCVGGHVHRAICSCGWGSPIRQWANTTIEDWHDHAWPGWRKLPAVPLHERPSITRQHTWVQQHYPAEWQTAGAPILTDRVPSGTRHVSGRSPWGGFDLSATQYPDPQ